MKTPRLSEAGSSVGTPRGRIEAACSRVGKEAVVRACIEMLGGGDPDPVMVTILGGPQAMQVIHGEHRTDQSYWVRVWAARGLLWAWDDVAVEALMQAMNDDAWRVREMCCKVVARHAIGDALPVVAALRTDPVDRVRRAAARAVILLTQSGA